MPYSTSGGVKGGEDAMRATETDSARDYECDEDRQAVLVGSKLRKIAETPGDEGVAWGTGDEIYEWCALCECAIERERLRLGVGDAAFGMCRGGAGLFSTRLDKIQSRSDVQFFK